MKDIIAKMEQKMTAFINRAEIERENYIREAQEEKRRLVQ